MNHYEKEYFSKMDSRLRANILNCLHGYKSPLLIGTKGKEENLAMFSNVFHLGARPHLIGMISRPDSVERDTLNNIKETKHFSINYIDANILKNAHHTSARFESSEFKECNLLPIYSAQCLAPYVKESKLRLGLELKEIQDISINNTHLIIGEVFEIFSQVDIEKLNLSQVSNIAVNGLDRYFQTDSHVRLSYAKPGSAPIELDFD